MGVPFLARWYLEQRLGIDVHDLLPISGDRTSEHRPAGRPEAFANSV
jgi:hypothetical protein